MNDKELLVLGILSIQPNYGYDLANMFKIISVKNWAYISLPYIYKILKKLLKKGWVERRVEVVENRPPRDIYEITDKGWNAIREVYEGNFNLEKKIFSEFYILLAVNNMIKEKYSIQPLVSRKIEFLEKEKTRLNKAFNQSSAGKTKPQSATLIFEHQMNFINMELDWLNKILTVYAKTNEA